MRRGPELTNWPGLPDCPITECAALGAMMARQDALDYGIKTLHSRIIGSEWNRYLFVALARLHRRQRHDLRLSAITAHTAAVELVRMKKWSTETEAYTYCRDCSDYCFNSENWRYYIDHCKETAQTRAFHALGEFLDLGAVLRGSALQPDADPNQLAAAVRECVDLILRDGCADIQTIFSRTK